MSPLMLGAVALLSVFLALACSTSGDDSSSPFWDAPGDVHGIDALREGLTELLEKHPEDIFLEADAVIVGTVKESVASSFSTISPVPGTEQLQDYLSRTASHTTHRIAVVRWLKGAADSQEVVVTELGGIDPAGSHVGFLDGDLMLEEGRTYVLFLKEVEPTEEWPREYARAWMSRGVFDATDGTIRVFNHPFTRDLEPLKGETLERFVARLLAVASQ
jgi:hypothetical protein